MSRLSQSLLLLLLTATLSCESEQDKGPPGLDGKSRQSEISTVDMMLRSRDREVLPEKGEADACASVFKRQPGQVRRLNTNGAGKLVACAATLYGRRVLGVGNSATEARRGLLDSLCRAEAARNATPTAKLSKRILEENSTSCATFSTVSLQAATTVTASRAVVFSPSARTGAVPADACSGESVTANLGKKPFGIVERCVKNRTKRTAGKIPDRSLARISKAISALRIWRVPADLCDDEKTSDLSRRGMLSDWSINLRAGSRMLSFLGTSSCTLIADGSIRKLMSLVEAEIVPGEEYIPKPRFTGTPPKIKRTKGSH